MKVKVKFFGSQRKVVGENEIDIELEEGTTLGELIRRLIERYPELKKLDKSTRMSVNHKSAQRSNLLEDGDEVALFPPVEGG